MFWVPTDQADAVWVAVGEAFAASSLPSCTSAKIGISEYKWMYVIAVTTEDYRNLPVRASLSCVCVCMCVCVCVCVCQSRSLERLSASYLKLGISQLDCINMSVLFQML